jgi:hypothetical protein
MGKIEKVLKVKLIIGILTNQLDLFEEVIGLLKKEYGTIDIKTDLIDFNHTNYYTQEMGKNLKKMFVSFEKLIEPNKIVDIKLKTNAIEEMFKTDNSAGRKINIDPGYIELAKLVLASTKNFSHRISLDKGIYAEVALIYQNKKYRFLPWTYPDYQKKEYLEFFYKTRKFLYQMS